MAAKKFPTDAELEDGAPETPAHEQGETPAFEGKEDAAAAAVQPEPPEGEAPAGGGDALQMADDLPEIRAIEQQLMAKIPPQLRSAVERIVLAGMKVMFSPQTRDIVMKQIESGATPEKVAQGVAALLSVLQGQSRGPMPQEAVVPAAILLVCQALDMLAKGGQMKVDGQVISATVQALVAYIAQKMGVKPPGAEGPPQQPPGQPQAGGEIPGGVSPSARQQGMPTGPGGGLVAGNMTMGG